MNTNFPQILYALAHGWKLRPCKERKETFWLVPAQPRDPRHGWASIWEPLLVPAFSGSGARGRGINMTILVPSWFGTEKAPLNLPPTLENFQ